MNTFKSVRVTPQSQYNGDFRNNSTTTFSNKSTSAGGTVGLWKANSLNTKNFTGSAKLMRDPDQIGSQMINKVGTNSSSLIFGNQISAAASGVMTAGQKLTQSN